MVSLSKVIIVVGCLWTVDAYSCNGAYCDTVRQWANDQGQAFNDSVGYWLKPVIVGRN
jgi:hypothetical protein